MTCLHGTTDNSVGSARTVLLLLGARAEKFLPNRWVAILTVNNCGSVEFHDKSLTAVAPTNNATGQSKLERSRFIGSKEQTVVQTERFALGNFVPRDGTVTARIKHARLSVFADNFSDERVLTTAQARNARAEPARDLNVGCATDEGARVKDPSTTVGGNTERQHIAGQFEGERNSTGSSVNVLTARLAGARAPTRGHAVPARCIDGNFAIHPNHRSTVRENLLTGLQIDVDVGEGGSIVDNTAQHRGGIKILTRNLHGLIANLSLVVHT